MGKAGPPQGANVLETNRRHSSQVKATFFRVPADDEHRGRFPFQDEAKREVSVGARESFAVRLDLGSVILGKGFRLREGFCK